MSIREKHQQLAAKYHWIFPIVVPILLGYLGIDQYEKYEERQAAAVPVTVTVTSSAPESTHAHGRVLSDTDIKQLIRDEIRVYDTQVKETYKRLEAWEKQ